jgi:hypothetical protein
MGVFRRKRGVEVLDIAHCGKKEKTGGAACQKGDELHPGPPADRLAQGADGDAETSKFRSKASS